MTQKKQDNRITGKQYEYEVLRLIGEFGFIIVAIAAYAVWWRLPLERAKVLARRVLLRLEAKGQVVRRRVSDYQISFFVLSEKGAKRLREEGIRYAKTGKDVQLGNQVLHDVMAMWLIYYIINTPKIDTYEAGISIFNPTYNGEYGCRCKQLKIDGKTPDGLIFYGDILMWLEVENSWKNVKRRQKIADFWARTFRYSSVNKLKLEFLVIAGSKDGVTRMKKTLSGYKHYPAKGHPDNRHEASYNINYIVIELSPDLNLINIYYLE